MSYDGPERRTWRSRIDRHLGRRGKVLLALGVAWMLQGYAIAEDAVLQPVDTNGLFHLALPVPLRVSLWVGCGALACLAAWYQAPRYQAIGFAALVLMPFERCLSYAGGWVIYLILGAESGYEQGWSSAATWGAVVAVIMVVADWPEQQTIPDGARRRP